MLVAVDMTMISDHRDPLLPLRLATPRHLTQDLWPWEPSRYATRRDSAAEGPIVAALRIRLRSRREGGGSSGAEGRLYNVQRAVRAIDGVRLEADQVLSFWRLVGEPSEARGYVRGTDPRAGLLVPTQGGGLSRLAGALLQVGLRSGLTVLEHHPPVLEPASDRERVRPFGAAAAVVHPHADLRLWNDTGARLDLRAGGTEDGHVWVEAVGEALPPLRIDIEERRCRLVHHRGQIYRAGELWQVWRNRETGVTQRERRLLAAEVAVIEEPAGHRCTTCDQPCRYAAAESAV